MESVASTVVAAPRRKAVSSEKLTEVYLQVQGNNGTYADIARKLGMPIASVQTRVSTLNKKLKAEDLPTLPKLAANHGKKLDLAALAAAISRAANASEETEETEESETTEA